MGVRADLAAALRAALPASYEVIDAARSIDQKTRPVVMLERTRVAKAPNAIGGWWITFIIHVISPVVGKHTADDALDDALDVTLAALDGIGFLTWEQATRSVFLDTYPSFQISVITVTER